MKFLDAAYAQSVPQMVAALQGEQAQGFAYYVGGNLALHAWESPIVTGVRDAGFQAMGIYVSTVAGRDGSADGAEAAHLQAIYGQDLLCCWDLEPSIYKADIAGALAYGVRWADAVRSWGLIPVLYSIPAACAFIGDKGFDAVWAAAPGVSDPSQIFAISFFPGKVAVQYGSGNLGGVDYDLNISEFEFTAAAFTVPPLPGPTPPPGPDVMPAEIPFPAVLVNPPGS